MSDLPRGWVRAKLSEVVTPRGERVSPKTQSDKQFIGLEHVEAHSTRILGSVPASEVKSAASVFRSGDVLYGRLRPYLNKVAKPDFAGLASAEFIVFPDQEHLRSGYLKHRLNARDFVSFASRLNAGDRPRVDFEQIGAFDVVVPPPAEQRRIVDKLEQLLSDLDAGTAALERARANLKRYRAAVLKAAVKGRLTERWRAAHPDVEPASKLLERILAERRKKWEEAQLKKFADKGQSPPKGWRESYPEPAVPESSMMAQLPKGWVRATIDQLSLVVRGASPRPAGSPRYFGGRAVPWITVGAITEDDDQMYLRSVDEFLTEEGKAHSRFIEPETLLLTNSGATLGVPKITLIGGCINDGSVALLGVGELLRRYLYYFLRTRTKSLRALNQGAAQPNLNTSIVKAILVPLPPEAEQAEIVQKIEELESGRITSQRLLDRGMGSSALLRQAILKRAFEGKLVPQDSRDEPASELLKRIHGARESARATPSATLRKRMNGR